MKNIFKIQKVPRKVPVASCFSGTTTYIHIRNTKFLFNADVSIYVKSLMVRATPLDPNNFYDLDDIYSHVYNVIGGEIALDFSVMERMLNKYVLDFEGAPLRNLSFSTFLDENNKRKFVVKGEMKEAIWISFTMTSTMTLDKTNNQIVITADEINTMEIIPADKFMKFLHVSLKNLIDLPQGLAISINKNSFVIKPLSLFPPPQLTGKMSAIKLEEKHIAISFEQLERVSVPARPIPNAVSDFFLFGGDVKIGQVRFLNMHIQILDRDPNGTFKYHIKNYFKHISEGIIRFPDAHAITISTLSYPKL
jgi:hypothetical protein